MHEPLPSLPTRSPDAHKGDFGRLLLIGGSRGMSGAIALAGRAAIRAGAGLVRLATADVCQSVVAGYEPAYMTLALPSDRAGRISRRALDELLRESAKADVVAIGPGLGRCLGLDLLVRRLYQRVAATMVVDADALNALAATGVDLADHAGPRILTPHPGEFRRLCPGDAQASREQFEAAATAFANRTRTVTLLKGRQTLITDGAASFHNATGNPGMATGGMGDVLTGVIAGLLGQKLSPFDAARLGAHLHGRAADLAAVQRGQVSLAPSDVIDFLGVALQNP